MGNTMIKGNEMETINEQVDRLADRLEVQLLRAKAGGPLDGDRLYEVASGLLGIARRLEDPYEVRMLREVGQKVARLAAVAVARRPGAVAFKDQVRFKIVEATR